jgi:large repetitive protein
MQASWLKLLGGGLALWALVGCNSSDDNSNSSSTTNASATGVWTGTDSVSGLNITALINSGGQATFIRSDGVQFTGTVQVSGNTLAATVDGYSDFGEAFSDGSTYGIGTLSGSVSTASTLTASLTFTTTDNTSITGTWSLTYDSLSTSGSSTSAVSGNYTDSLSGATISITSAGAMTSQNPTNGCVLNGSISTADSTTDVYEVAFSYESCTGGDVDLNGVQFTGLAFLNTSTSPAQLDIAVTGASSSTHYGFVSTLTGT